ncbi:MAG: PQQ-binding-like beta-propeller repeat protein [Acidiferrobacterales bacterium]
MIKNQVRGGCLWLALLASFQLFAAETIYPANPAITEDAIYVSSEGITRFHRQTLEPVWHALAGKQTFEPVVTKTRIFVATTQGLYVLDLVTGKVLRRLARDQTLFPPAVAGDVAYIGGRDGSLRAVTVKTGGELWHRDFTGWIYTPAVVEGKLIVGGNGRLLRGIDANTSKELWHRKLDQELVYRPIAVGSGKTIITLFNGEILMIDANDGSTVWRVRGQTPSFSPAVAKRYLYFGTFAGRLMARSRGGGDIVWEQQLNGRLHYRPRVIGGVVLVASDQAELAAYDAHTGERLWHHADRRELVTSPIILNDVVVGFANDRTPHVWRVPSISKLNK